MEEVLTNGLTIRYKGVDYMWYEGEWHVVE